MRIIHSEAAFDAAASVAALGMFDGVHIGHQALIRRAVALARAMDAACVVCTFDRHPLSVLCPERAPKPLLPLEQNLEKFEQLGADYALVQSFTPEYSVTPPETFLAALAAGLLVRAVVAGENYTFGAGGRGDAALIRRMAPRLGYRAEIVPPVMDGDVMCSSTWIRRLLARGELEHARRLMEIGEPQGDAGEDVHGRNRS